MHEQSKYQFFLIKKRIIKSKIDVFAPYLLLPLSVAEHGSHVLYRDLLPLTDQSLSNQLQSPVSQDIEPRKEIYIN